MKNKSIWNSFCRLLLSLTLLGSSFAQSNQDVNVVYINGITNTLEDTIITTNKINQILVRSVNHAGSAKMYFNSFFVWNPIGWYGIDSKPISLEEDLDELFILKSHEENSNFKKLITSFDNPIATIDVAAANEIASYLNEIFTFEEIINNFGMVSEVVPMERTKLATIKLVNHIKELQISKPTIIVAHSQGNLLANLAYAKLAAEFGNDLHQKIRVVNVANTSEFSVNNLNFTHSGDAALFSGATIHSGTCGRFGDHSLETLPYQKHWTRSTTYCHSSKSGPICAFKIAPATFTKPESYVSKSFVDHCLNHSIVETYLSDDTIGTIGSHGITFTPTKNKFVDRFEDFVYMAANSLLYSPGKLTGITNLYTGTSHAFALKNDGTVWAWGDNQFGELGIGTEASNFSPIQLSGISRIISLDIGATTHYTLALNKDGEVWTWGNNEYGQLGNGAKINSSYPVKVNGLNNIIAISAGAFHALALRNDGTIWTWGNNQFGQLGNETLAESLTPIKVGELANIIAIDTFDHYNIALRGDGTVWTWGGATTWMNTFNAIPTQISGLTNVTAIAMEYYYNLALSNDGRVWSWGINESGVLGNGITDVNFISPTPVLVSGLTDIVAIDTGLVHALALKSDGTVWAWGNNEDGQLGYYESGSIMSSIPFPVFGLANIKAIDASMHHSIALSYDKSVFTWGDNAYFQLGNGTSTNSSIPIAIGLKNDIITNISASSYNGYALSLDGAIWAWGYNAYGQLGNGSTINSSIPILVEIP